MPSRKTFCLPSLVTTGISLILLLLVTISLPLTTHVSTSFYIAQASNLNGTIVDTTSGANADRGLSSIRGGLWGYCSAASTGGGGYDYCSDNDHQYTISLNSTNNPEAAYTSTEIRQSWTQGLVVAVVAFVATIIGFILSFFPHLAVQLVAALVLFVAFLLALLAFILQIVYFVYFQNRIHRLNDDASVSPGAGFYMTLVTIPLLLFSSFTVACGWKQDRSGKFDGSGYAAGGGATTASKGGGMKSRIQPWKKNRGANGTTATSGGYGDRDYAAETGQTKDNIPLTSRDRVLAEYNRS